MPYLSNHWTPCKPATQTAIPCQPPETHTHPVRVLGIADSITFIYVLFGAALFVVAKAGLSQNLNQVLQNFGQGAVYSGWLGLLIGAVAIAKNTPLEALGPAISIALLPVLYAYFFKWVVVTALDSSGSTDE